MAKLKGTWNWFWGAWNIYSLLSWVVGNTMIQGLLHFVSERWSEAPLGVRILNLTWIAGVTSFVVALVMGQIRKKKADANGKLQIGVKEVQVKTLDYYEAVLRGHVPGDKEITVNVLMAPAKPVTLDRLYLELWQKTYEAIQLPDTRIRSTNIYPVTFAVVPKGFAIDSKNARIGALADNVPSYSQPFAVMFDAS